MDLKIKDVADLLNVSETTIRRWLSDGKIPAYKINHQYRFSRFEIEDWVMSQKLGTQTGTVPYNEQQLDPLDKEDDKAAHAGRKQFSLYRAIHKGGVLHDIPGNTKEEIIRATMKRIASELNLDAEVITELLLDRENLQPTALNHGIGIPHTRECLLKAGQNVVTVVFPKHPIPYGALDEEPVHTLFFLFAGDDKRHLHLLAKIAHLSGQPKTLAILRSKPTKNQLLDYIRDWESRIGKDE
jgi:PTS system nitrogen regulatory IIA component